MAKKTETLLCPRREELASEVFKLPETDSWRTEKNGIRTCSHCGSLHPDDFMKFVEYNAEIGPTDKSYKFYITAANDSVKGAGKFYTQHFQGTGLGANFRALIKQRNVNWGLPGYPYVALYVPVD